jgi:hypothetical protein
MYRSKQISYQSNRVGSRATVASATHAPDLEGQFPRFPLARVGSWLGEIPGPLTTMATTTFGRRYLHEDSVEVPSPTH